jgi:N-methylhydantoinase B/oxoprolinase/acetone carboxylase alpha subunit
MTKQELINYKKATALNKIRKLYNPKTKHNFTYYKNEGSKMEQISFEVKHIIENLEIELNRIK